MTSDNLLRIGLLLAMVLVIVSGLLTLFFYERPYFPAGLFILAAVVEMGLSRYQGSEERNEGTRNFR